MESEAASQRGLKSDQIIEKKKEDKDENGLGRKATGDGCSGDDY